jgi:hypothetical protein
MDNVLYKIHVKRMEEEIQLVKSKLECALLQANECLENIKSGNLDIAFLYYHFLEKYDLKMETPSVPDWQQRIYDNFIMQRHLTVTK